VIQDQFREDLGHWIRTDPRVALRLMELMEDVRRHPFEGKGQPELLKHNLQGKWSRRMTGEHRLVYEVFPDRISFVSARYHY
jgi:toxin YoeB